MNTSKLLVLVFMWLFWLCSATALPFYWFFLVRDTPSTNTFGPVDLFMAIMYFGPLLSTGLLRWVVIPKIKCFPLRIIPFFIGVALAVFMTFCGIFLFDRYLIVFLATSALALLQFLPYSPKNQDRTSAQAK